MKRVAIFPALVLALLLPFGCGRRDATLLPKRSGPLSVALNTNEVLIGQPFTLTAIVQAGPSDRIEWPAPGIPPAVMQRNSRDLSKEVPSGHRAHQWDLMALRPGTFPVWTGTVVRTSADGAATRLEIPRMEVRAVSSLEPGEENIRDITGLQQWPKRLATRLLAMLGAVALLALFAALLVRIILRKRKKAAIAPPPVPPHERALQALRALRARGWPDTEGVESFYVELSAIVRRYLEEAFRMRAPEQTTEEFIRAATTSRLLQLEHQQLVVAFLEQSDLVKFARYQPAQPDMESALAAAERLVLETRPSVAPEAQPPLRAV